MSDVCLIYTVHNRGALLCRSLGRLRELTLPTEVLIVDDGGTRDDSQDSCYEVAADFGCGELGCPVHYVYTNNVGDSICSHARNVAIKNTDCEYVVTSEPELWFETDAIAQLLARTAEHPTEVVSAGIVNHEQSPGGACVQTVGWVAPFLALYKREWLLEINGWDEQFPSAWGWEDTDLLTRLRIKGYGQFIDRDISVTHLWHPPRWAYQGPNESHFRRKSFHGDERTDNPDLVANQGIEWGVRKP